jgi:predicted permease
LNAILNSISIVLPVVLMLVIGRLFARAKGFHIELSRGLASLVYWVCLPALEFREIVRTAGSTQFNWRLCGGLLATIVIFAVVGYRYARLRSAPENKVGVIAQGSFRSNMMYVGLPVLLYYAQLHGSVLGGDPLIRNQIARMTAIGAAVSIPLLNIATILCFELCRRKRPGHIFSGLRVLREIVLNPLILGIVFAVGVSAIPGGAGWFEKDTVSGKTLDMVAAAALPLALFAIGAILDVRRACAGLSETLPVTFIKLIAMPAIGFGLFRVMGVRGPALAVGVILLACPDATSGHAMAAQYGGDEELAGELVAITTLLCPLTIVGWLTVLTYF